MEGCLSKATLDRLADAMESCFGLQSFIIEERKDPHREVSDDDEPCAASSSIDHDIAEEPPESSSREPQPSPQPQPQVPPELQPQHPLLEQQQRPLPQPATIATLPMLPMREDERRHELDMIDSAPPTARVVEIEDVETPPQIEEVEPSPSPHAEGKSPPHPPPLPPPRTPQTRMPRPPLLPQVPPLAWLPPPAPSASAWHDDGMGVEADALEEEVLNALLEGLDEVEQRTEQQRVELGLRRDASRSMAESSSHSRRLPDKEVEAAVAQQRAKKDERPPWVHGNSGLAYEPRWSARTGGYVGINGRRPPDRSKISAAASRSHGLAPSLQCWPLAPRTPPPPPQSPPFVQIAASTTGSPTALARLVTYLAAQHPPPPLPPPPPAAAVASPSGSALRITKGLASARVPHQRHLHQSLHRSCIPAHLRGLSVEAKASQDASETARPRISIKAESTAAAMKPVSRRKSSPSPRLQRRPPSSTTTS